MAVKTLISLVGGIIKSIQRGTVTNIGTGTNVTVSAVDMSKSFIAYTQESTALSPDRGTGTCILTTTTNLLFSRQGSSQTLDAAWELIEYV